MIISLLPASVPRIVWERTAFRRQNTPAMTAVPDTKKSGFTTISPHVLVILTSQGEDDPGTGSAPSMFTMSPGSTSVLDLAMDNGNDQR